MFVMRAKPTHRAAARELRKEGVPIKRIAKEVGVSPSSVVNWTRDIILTPEQRERNLRGPRGPQCPDLVARRVEAIKRSSRTRRLRYQQEGRMQARAGNGLHRSGCMLYWAEGAKERNSVRFCNSDIHMVRFFKLFLEQCLGVREEKFRLSLHVYLGNGLSLHAIERRWLQALGLPASCAQKHLVNPLPTSSSGSKRNKLPLGVCTLSVYDTRVVQHIYGAIQEYGGFEEPRWLDGPPRRARADQRPAAAT
jgi:hypothetical protein